MKPGYKRTELGAIPEDWTIAELGSLTVLMTNGFVGPATRHYTANDDGVLYIQGYNVEENSFNLHGVKSVTKDFHRAHMRSCLRSDDMLTVQTGDVGLTALVPKSLAGSNCHALIISRFNRKLVSPALVSYYMNSRPGRARLRLIETGTTMKHLNVGDVLHFSVPVPSTKTEQDAIADVLGDVDVFIKSLEQLIAKKRHIKSGAMQELLTGRMRLPGFVGKWAAGVMSDYFAPIRSRNAELNDTVLTISAQRGFVRQEEFFNKRVASKVLENYYLIERGNFAYNRSYSNGYPFGAIKRLTRYFKGVVTTLYICFALKPDAPADESFCEQYFEAGLLNRGLSTVTNEGGRAHGLLNITKAEFYSREVTFPPLAEQVAIASVLGDMDAEIAALEAKLAKVRQIKQGMMSELLTGRIRLV